MDKVLMIAGHSEFIENLQSDLEKYRGQFEVFFTEDEAAAVDYIQTHRISVFVSGYNLEQLNMKNLLNLVTKRLGQIAFIQFFDRESLLKEEVAYKEKILSFIEVPCSGDELAEEIIQGLDCLDEGVMWRQNK